jgi:hypothetical protein
MIKKFEISNLNENPCNGSRSVQCQWTDRQTDLTELLFAFRNNADSPQNVIFYSKGYIYVFFLSQNKQRLLPYTALTVMFP